MVHTATHSHLHLFWHCLFAFAIKLGTSGFTMQSKSLCSTAWTVHWVGWPHCGMLLAVDVSSEPATVSADLHLCLVPDGHQDEPAAILVMGPIQTNAGYDCFPAA